ncbi:hypothetical protein KXD40_002132 [Peronospora effusa]|nr:hypothetical protein KXD40_002132 [Peronospora effusa]
MRLQNINTLQNKVDRVKDDATVAQHEKMTRFVAATAPSAPRLPLFRPWSSTMWTWLEKLTENVMQVAQRLSKQCLSCVAGRPWN